jgi:hypothetical protein
LRSTGPQLGYNSIISEKYIAENPRRQLPIGRRGNIPPCDSPIKAAANNSLLQLRSTDLLSCITFSMAVSLTYFDGRGLGEIPRLLLHEAGVKFEDRRLKDIAPLKGELPFGQVPLYQEGDFKLVQSQTIARYIARTHNLYGKDAKESAQIDLVVDGVGDLRTQDRNAKDVSLAS